MEKIKKNTTELLLEDALRHTVRSTQTAHSYLLAADEAVGEDPELDPLTTVLLQQLAALLGIIEETADKMLNDIKDRNTFYPLPQ